MYQKNFVHDKWAILGPKMAHPHNSGSALRIFLKFCRMKGANRYMKILLVVFREKNSFGARIRILKQWRHDFSGKHLRDGYCMDIMWCLCVEVKIQQRVIWFCKASLRICYGSLFECEGPLMLKTDSLIF